MATTPLRTPEKDNEDDVLPQVDDPSKETGQVPDLLHRAAHPGVVFWEEVIQHEPAYDGKTMREVARILGFPHSSFHGVMTGRASMSDRFADDLAAATRCDRRMLEGLRRAYQDLVNEWDGSFYDDLTQSVLLAADRLDLDAPTLAKILGVEPPLIHDLRCGRDRLSLGTNAYSQASLLVEICELLHALLGEDSALYRRWLTAPNAVLKPTPLASLRTLQGLAHVVDYLRSSTGS